MMNIVLFNPEIPQNTGNIARTCAATGATLHLIEPLGFSLSDKYLKRAGLDYWNLMTYHTYPDFGEFLRQHPDARMHFASTKAPRGYHEATYQDGDFLIFGCETRGLPGKPAGAGLRPLHPHPDAPGSAKPESVKLRRYRSLRSAAADGFPRSEQSGPPDRARRRTRAVAGLRLMIRFSDLPVP